MARSFCGVPSTRDEREALCGSLIYILLENAFLFAIRPLLLCSDQYRDYLTAARGQSIAYRLQLLDGQPSRSRNRHISSTCTLAQRTAPILPCEILRRIRGRKAFLWASRYQRGGYPLRDQLTARGFFPVTWVRTFLIGFSLWSPYASRHSKARRSNENGTKRKGWTLAYSVCSNVVVYG